MSETQPGNPSHAPMLGEHNKEIICDVLGRSEEYFNELKKKGVVSYS